MHPPGGGCSAANLSTGQLSDPPHHGPFFGRADLLDPFRVFIRPGVAPISKKKMTSPELGGRPLPRAEPRKAPNLYPEGPLRRVSHGLNAHRASVERGWSLWVPRQKTERISDPMACGIAGKG